MTKPKCVKILIVNYLIEFVTKVTKKIKIYFIFFTLHCTAKIFFSRKTFVTFVTNTVIDHISRCLTVTKPMTKQVKIVTKMTNI